MSSGCRTRPWRSASRSSSTESRFTSSISAHAQGDAIHRQWTHRHLDRHRRRRDLEGRPALSCRTGFTSSIARQRIARAITGPTSVQTSTEGGEAIWPERSIFGRQQVDFGWTRRYSLPMKRSINVLFGATAQPFHRAAKALPRTTYNLTQVPPDANSILAVAARTRPTSCSSTCRCQVAQPSNSWRASGTNTPTAACPCSWSPPARAPMPSSSLLRTMLCSSPSVPPSSVSASRTRSPLTGALEPPLGPRSARGSAVAGRSSA